MAVPYHDSCVRLYTLFLFFTAKAFYYDTMLYSIHFTSFLLVIYSLLLGEMLLISKVNMPVLFALPIITLLVLVVLPSQFHLKSIW